MSGSVFALPSMPTMRDALSSLDAQCHIPPRKRQRFVQDVLKACEWFGIKPEDLIANHANLNPRFRAISPGKHGVTKKRVANIKNSVKCVLSFLPTQNHRSFKAELSPACESFSALVPNRY